MERKELRARVLERHPTAVCRRVKDSATWVVTTLGPAGESLTVGSGISKKDAWRNAAERLARRW